MARGEKRDAGLLGGFARGLLRRAAPQRRPAGGARRRRVRAALLAALAAALAGAAVWLRWGAEPPGEVLDSGARDPLPRLLEEIETGSRPSGWIVAAGGIELLAEPRADAASAGRLRRGAPVVIREEAGGWARVSAHPSGPAGWVPSVAIGAAEQALDPASETAPPSPG